MSDFCVLYIKYTFSVVLFLKTCNNILLQNCVFLVASILSSSMINRRVSVLLFFEVSRFGMNIEFAEFAVWEFILSFLIYDQPVEGRREIPPPRDPRFEMLELVLLTLGFPFRLGLPGYYRLSGRFVMTPEATILVLSAAHYRRGMTVVAFIFFSVSISLFFSRPPSFPPTRTFALRMFRQKSCGPPNVATCNLACRYWQRCTLVFVT